MTNKEIITNAFDDEIKRIFSQKSEIMHWLLKHERKPVLINNLLKEVFNIETSRAVTLTREKIEMISKEFALSFARASILQQEHQLLTELQKSEMTRKKEESDNMLAEIEKALEIYDRSESIG
jgi:hypothetical protein